MESTHPTRKESIHGHATYCDDKDARYYLKHLDEQEAKALFQYTHEHGRTDFEMKHEGTRYNCHITYADGAYVVDVEGKQHSGWF